MLVHRVRHSCCMQLQLLNRVTQHSPILFRSKSEAQELAEYDFTQESLKPSEVKPKIKMEIPFVKGLFLGKFDPNLLTYPEPIDVERLKTITDYVGQIENYMTSVDSEKIDQNCEIPQSVWQGLKDLDLFKLRVPKEHGGLNFNETEWIFVKEALGYDGAISDMVSSNVELGLAAISLFGTDVQKAKYLPKIKSGECITCFCFTEPETTPNRKSFLETVAIPSEDGKTYQISGVKNWVSNADRADLFIVVASTNKLENERMPTMSVFLIDKYSNGITVGKKFDKIGIRGSGISDVIFDNTVVSSENILGELHIGSDIITKIECLNKFSIGSQCSAIMKRLIHDVTNYCINTRSFNKCLIEYESVQGSLATMTRTAYVVESLTYLLSGMMDTYEDPDVNVEASIIKVMASEGLDKVIKEAFQLFGHKSFIKEGYFDRINRDAQYFLRSEPTNSMRKVMIACSGLQFAGSQLHEEIKKVRNPLMFPSFIMKKLYSSRHQMNDTPKLKLGLEGYLHPSLQDAARAVEYCVSRLQYGTEVVLSRNGSESVDKHLELILIAELAMDIFAMTAILGRASRSYCIGLRHSDMEMELALSYVHYAHERNKKIMQKVMQGPIPTGFTKLLKIGNSVITNKGYFAAHPLTMNF